MLVELNTTARLLRQFCCLGRLVLLVIGSNKIGRFDNKVAPQIKRVNAVDGECLGLDFNKYINIYLIFPLTLVLFALMT